MRDAVALGELLIDFTPLGRSENGNMIFESNPGGAPANVLAMLSKLGKSTAFIGKVGNDAFGRFLHEVLGESGIDSRGLVFSDINTTLAFVHLDKHGDRTFSFYRKPGADTDLRVDDVDFRMIEGAKIFHFGSVSMTDEPSRSATLEAVKYAKQHNIIISYDPNLRPSLWESEKLALEIIMQGMEYADIVKISEEESIFLTGTDSIEKGSEYLAEKYHIKLVVVTSGKKGGFCRVGKKICQMPAFDVKTIDTTGAGDTFWGAFLYKILENGKSPEMLSEYEIKEFMIFANAAGSLSTAKKGAIPSMPSLEEIEECINRGHSSTF